MKKIFENDIIRVIVSGNGEDSEIVIVNKMSDMEDTRLTVTGHEDGHLAIRANNCRFHPAEKGFNLWLN